MRVIQMNQIPTSRVRLSLDTNGESCGRRAVSIEFKAQLSSELPYAMGTNYSGLGCLLSQTLTLSSPLPGVVVDVNPTSGSAIKIRDLLFFSLVLPFEDDDDTAADSSIGLRQYIGGLSVAIKREEIRP